MAIPHFQRYVLRDDKKKDDSEESDPRDVIFTNTGPLITADALWDSLNTANSRADRLILHEIARRRVPGFPRDPNMSLSEDDESESSEEDEFRGNLSQPIN